MPVYCRILPSTTNLDDKQIKDCRAGRLSVLLKCNTTLSLTAGIFDRCRCATKHEKVVVHLLSIRLASQLKVLPDRPDVHAVHFIGAHAQ